jgi:hypothetical protein
LKELHHTLLPIGASFRPKFRSHHKAQDGKEVMPSFANASSHCAVLLRLVILTFLLFR